MSVSRIMGIETEYGIVKHGDPYANPMLMSSQVVLAYRDLAALRRRTRWDYMDENPLVDARGFVLERASAHPSMLTDDPSRPAPSGIETSSAPVRVLTQDRPHRETYDDPGSANVVLTNGARLYVDHAHPEYSSPEVTNPLDAVRWDVAGEHVMRAGAAEASRLTETDIVVYKNNVDGKGASYGTHENYLVDREVPFEDLVAILTPFFVTRNVMIGSGRVGIGVQGQSAGFQISQRADYIEAEVGLETTLRRPIINTRDEPHADRNKWRRLHVIIGDANLFQFATYLKLGTTACVLWLAENIHDQPDLAARVGALALADPVSAVQVVSRDLNLTTPLALADGRAMTALEIQREYLAVVRELRARRAALSDARPGSDGDAESDAQATTALLDDWDQVLADLSDDLWSTADRVEWVAKLQLLNRLREREGIEWDHPRLAALDLQWSDVRPGRGIAAKLVSAGAVRTLVSTTEIEAAVTAAPDDTRAYFRGEVLARFGESVVAASWDSVVLDVPGAPSLSRIPMLEPERGTRRQLGHILDSSASVADLVHALSQ